MSDEPRDPADSKLEALFRADPGPTPSELIAARLKLKRALARDNQRALPRDRADPTAVHDLAAARLAARRRPLWIASQAAGFALLIALLAPIVPRVMPARVATPRSVDLVASLVDEARSVRERLKPWLPSFPSLPPFSLPSLHSDAR